MHVSFRTRTYFCSHYSVGSDLLSAKTHYLLVHHLKDGGSCILKEKGKAEVVEVLIKMHCNVP